MAGDSQGQPQPLFFQQSQSMLPQAAQPAHFTLVTQAASSTAPTFFQASPIASKPRGHHGQVAKGRPDMDAQTISVPNLRPATGPAAQIRYNPYSSAGGGAHPSQPSGSLEQTSPWQARAGLAGANLIGGQSSLSQSFTYQGQTIRPGLGSDTAHIFSPTQQTPGHQHVAPNVNYEYVQVKVGSGKLSQQGLGVPYSAVQGKEHMPPPMMQPHSQSYAPAQPLAPHRYSFPSSASQPLSHIPSSYDATQLQTGALTEPMMAQALALRSQTGTASAMHPSKNSTKSLTGPLRPMPPSNSNTATLQDPQATGLQSSATPPASGMAYNTSAGRTQSLRALDSSPGLAGQYSLSATALSSSSLPQPMSFHMSGQLQGLPQDDSLQTYPIHVGQLATSTLFQGPSDGKSLNVKGESVTGGHGAEEDLQWKIPRGVTNIEQIIEQWERGDGLQCPALCHWTVGMRRRERSIFSQRKKLYEEYLRLGSVQAFNQRYKDLPIGRVYAIVSSRNRKQRRESNLANSVQTEPKGEVL